MSFNEYLKNYADLIVTHGLNVQPGQVVNLAMEPYHKALGILMAECAYKKGAKYVNLSLEEASLARMRLDNVNEEGLAYVPAFMAPWYKELVDARGANLRIVGPEDPDVLEGADPKKVNISRLARYQAVKYFYDEGIGKSGVHWCVAAAATPMWGLKVFPEAGSPEEAERLLWDEIFRICRVDRPDYLQAWKEHNKVLQQRARLLTELQVKELHFQGAGTDLKVGLSTAAIFKGGGDVGPWGVEYEPNLPTEECFTTPDFRKTEGHVRATRPIMINGSLIEGLELRFEQGRITNFSAKKGAETFEEYINSDTGARQLGEVALVGIDSPVYQSGRVFEEILFDENAACHIAIGSAYKFCIKGGDSLNSAALAEIGCNESSVHTDIMISSEEVSVSALTYSGESLPVIKDGRWLQRFC